MDRFYKSNKATNIGRDSLLLVDNAGWKGLQVISLDTLNTVLQFNTVDIENFIDKTTIVLDPSTLKLRINDSFSVKSSVMRVKFTDQHIIPNLPPDTTPVDTALHLATDSNFLYIWVEDSSRWKRIPLSEF